MAEINKVDGEEEEVTTTTEEVTTSVETDEQDPLKKELDKVQKNGVGRTKKEKLLYTKNKIEEQLRELDGENGVDDDLDEDDDKPVTIGMMKKMRQESATKTALQIADDIDDEVERELVKHHVANTIRTTGNPKEDVRLARAIVNSAKNTKIVEEITRKPSAVTHSSSTSAPATKLGTDTEFTAEEQSFMQAPFNLTKEQVLKVRQGK